jgi:Glycine cleavage system protein P (pyridoxal-binding), C-terminal domain
MAGMIFVTVKCELSGNTVLGELHCNANYHSEEITRILITYTTTRGVYEDTVSKVCNVIHLPGSAMFI